MQKPKDDTYWINQIHPRLNIMMEDFGFVIMPVNGREGSLEAGYVEKNTGESIRISVRKGWLI